jgi:hypothetical protein
VKLRIPVRQIEWNLEEERYTPAMPEQGHLKLLSSETQYIDLVPYGCTELRLTVFPDANAEPLEYQEPDYTRPANASDCVSVVDGKYCAYFELPRFCWDTPIYCKVRTADGTDDLQSCEGGDLCELVGTTDIGREIWRWTGPAITETKPVEIIFTNHDLLTGIMPFDNGGYYNYDTHLYNAGQTTGIIEVKSEKHDGAWYDMQGRKLSNEPTRAGVYIKNGNKVIIK